MGTFLPGDQASLERDYKRELQLRHGIVFDRLFTITNMPISRFLEHIERTGNLQRYMELLVSSFNPRAADGVMCRTYLSVGWDGTLYDCDFNQMLDDAVEPRGAADALRAARVRKRRPAARGDRSPLLRLHRRGGLLLRGRRGGAGGRSPAASLSGLLRPTPRRLPSETSIGQYEREIGSANDAHSLEGSVAGNKTDTIAVDVLLEPDARMLAHAEANNARLLAVFPGGFALDAAHRPHITLLQCFVAADGLEAFHAAVGDVLRNAGVTGMALQAVRYYYEPGPGAGVAGICVAPTPELLELQANVIAAAAPSMLATATIDAFTGGHDNPAYDTLLIDYVSGFAAKHAARASIRTSRPASRPSTFSTG